MIGALVTFPALSRADLLAEPVHAALSALTDGALRDSIEVAEIDPALADTAAFCARYGVEPEASANCVIVSGRRGSTMTMTACVILATTRADVNGLVRRRLDARKASFAAMDVAVALTGMEYGGITPIGLPQDWPILIDARIPGIDRVVVGSGLRRSKIVLPGAAVALLPGAEVTADLGG